MFQQKSDKPFVRSQWSPVDDQWCIGFIVLPGKFQFETTALGKIDLVGGQGKFAPDNTPYLYINLGAIKSRLVRHFYKRRIGPYQYIPDHCFCLLPQCRFIYVLLSEFGGIMQG